MNALRSYARLGLQKLLDIHLGNAASRKWWICLRNSNWVQDEVGSDLFLLASEGFDGDPKLASFVHERIGKTLFAVPAAIGYRSRDLIHAMLAPVAGADSILLPLL